MSAFTEWNGPPGGRGPNTKDVLALIDAYNQAIASLSKHIESTAPDNVHGFKSALDNAITSLSNEVSAALAGKADSSGTAQSIASLEASVASVVGTLNGYRAEAVKTQDALDAETERASEREESLSMAIDALAESLQAFKETFDAKTASVTLEDGDILAVDSFVQATQAFIGALRAEEYIDFTKWRTFPAQFAGTGTSDSVTSTNGIYILGELSGLFQPETELEKEHLPKSAVAFIKYVGTRPFDIVAFMSATSSGGGTVSCLASFETPWPQERPGSAWEDMALHLVKNTDSSGAPHVHLGISAKGLSGQSTKFHVAGINFYPNSHVSGICERIGFTRVKQGFNAYRANIDDMRVESLNDAYGKQILKVEYNDDLVGVKHKDIYIADPSFEGVYFLKRPSVIFAMLDEDEDTGEEISPVLTVKDITIGDSIKGIIAFWPRWEEVEVDGVAVRRAVGYPDGWIACDGSTVPTEDYPSLIGILGLGEGATEATLPRIDHAIMRIEGLFDGIAVEDTPTIRILTRKELTEAVYNVQKNVEEEAATREEADIVLQENIDAEAAARMEADSNLQTNINAETNARIQDVENLQTNINAETNARIQDVANLQTNINAETNARVAADEQLKANIDAENAERQEADSNLQTNINAETNARVAADEQLQTSITAETNARVAADERLQTNIIAEAAERQAADEAEAAERQAADEALQEQVDGLDERKAESFQGSKGEFDVAKDGLKDGTIVLSPDDLNHP